MSNNECWSRDGEEFRYDSLGDLLDNWGEELKPGDIVHVGTAKRPTADYLCDAEDVLETIGVRGHDIGGEYADDFPSVDDAAKAELNGLLSAWITKHLLPTSFYQVLNVREYVLTEEDFAA